MSGKMLKKKKKQGTPKTVQELFSTALKKSGKTQEQLAEACGVSQVRISQLCRDAHASPELARKIESAIGFRADHWKEASIHKAMRDQARRWAGA